MLRCCTVSKATDPVEGTVIMSPCSLLPWHLVGRDKAMGGQHTVLTAMLQGNNTPVSHGMPTSHKHDAPISQ